MQRFSGKYPAGFLIKLTDEKGNLGFGEIAPLPNRSQESMRSAQIQLTRLRQNLIGKNIPLGVEKLNGKFTRWFSRYKLAPSVRFGLETAILTLLADQRQISLSKLITDLPKRKIQINALLDGGPSEIPHQKTEVKQRGFRYAKLKIGHKSVTADAQKVKEIIKTFGNKIQIRLDVNQRWNLKQALDFVKKIPRRNIEYIEEPFKQKYLISTFFDVTKIPVAVDETLFFLKPPGIEKIKGVKAIILKPSVLGGIEKTMEWVKWAQKNKVKPVISSSFETEVGIYALGHLAACVKDNVAAGLDTLKYFRQSLLKTKVGIENGSLNVADLKINSRNFNSALLKKV